MTSLQKNFTAAALILLTSMTLNASAGTRPIREAVPEAGQFNRQKGMSFDETLIIDEQVRRSIVHLPAKFNSEKNLPLVIVLHGAKLTPRIAELVTGFNKLSNENNFIVAYPEALYRQWNDGRAEGDTPSYKIDDKKFIDEFMTYMQWKYKVDPKKIYLVGYSSGGMLSFKLGMEMTDKIAAIATVAASIPQHQLDQKEKPDKPISVLMINGTADPAFPWNGGNTHIVGIRVGKVSSVEDTVKFWIDANGGLTEAPDKNQSFYPLKPGARVDTTFYPTKDNTCVVLYKIKDGGHTWPGSDVPLRYIPFLGRQSRDLSASELIWEFFKTK